MKQKVNIEVTFEENYQIKEPVKEINLKKALQAWQTPIVELLQARLQACKTRLFENRDRVVGVSEYAIQYVTKGNVLQHYSLPAARSMAETIKAFQCGDFYLNTMNLIQILKALYWAPDSVRNLRLDGVSFDDLYSFLLLHMGDESLPVFHP